MKFASMKFASIAITALVLGGCACITVVDKHRDSVPAVDVLERLYEAGLEVYSIQSGSNDPGGTKIFLALKNMCVPDPETDIVRAPKGGLSAAEHAERVARLKAEAFRLLRGKVYSDAAHTTAPALTVGTNACLLWIPPENS